MIKNFTDADVPDQSGRTFVVTGANTGLGLETARVLCARGARVLFACRSEEKALAAMDEVAAENPDADMAFVPLDQASLASVHAAAEIIAKESRLDVLINNAGIMVPPLEYTEDGFESQFGVNHLGTFALTGLLLEKLGEQEDSRVVCTSSIAHKMNSQIFFDDIDASQSYNKFTRYGQSKLANMLYTLELDRRLQGAGSSTLSVGCHPGIASTELGRYMPPAMTRISNSLVAVLLNTPAKGAWPTLAAATSEWAEPGGYYGPNGFREWRGRAADASVHRNARDEEVAERLWELSIEMTGVDPGI